MRMLIRLGGMYFDIIALTYTGKRESLYPKLVCKKVSILNWGEERAVRLSREIDTLQLCLPFFFSEQADSEKMENQPITPAEHTSHEISKQTRWAKIGTGAAQSIIAAPAAYLA